MAADISLLFGVLGEGSLSGDSGKLIQSQLTQIMTELNKSPLKVKVGLDTTSGGKQSWSSQLQQKLDQISASGKFSAQISTLKLSPGAVSDFKKQITSIVSTLGLSTGAEIKVTPKGVDEATRQVEQVGNAASNAAKKAAELASAASSVSAKLSGASQQASKSREEIVAYSTQLNVLKTVLGGVESIYKSASFGNSMLTDPANIDKVTASVNNLKLHIEEASKISIGDIAGLERENELIKQEAKELVELVFVLRQVETAEQAVNTNSPMSTERIAQLASLKSSMDAISSTFNSAVFGKNMITDATSIQEITNKFVECTVRAKEALATSADDTATLKNRVTLLQENAKELQELVTLSRQLETPGVDYEVQFKALKATISSIDSLFNSAIAGKSKFENPAHIAEITSEYERFRTAAKEALDSSQTGNANDLKERVAALRNMASEFQTLVATKRQFEQPGTEFDVQLQTLKATISSIDSLFNSAIAGKSKFENPAYITEVTTEYEKFKRVATEALNVSQSGNTDALKKNVVQVQNAAGEFQKLISLARQLEMPGTDYTAKLREVQVIIRSIKSEFDSIVAGRRGIVSEEEVQTASALYRQVEEIERRIKSVTDAKGLQNEIPALQSIRSQILDIDEAIKQAKARLDALVAQKDTIGNTLGKLTTTSTVGEEQTKIDEITAKYAQWAAKIEEVKAAKAAVPTSEIAAIEAEGATILSNIERLNEERTAREDAAKAVDEAAKRMADADRKETASATERNNLYKQITSTLIQLQEAQKNWTAAQNGKSSQSYADIDGYIERVKQLQAEFSSLSAAQVKERLSKINAEFKASSEAIRAAGENTKTLSARIGNLAQKFGAWLSVSQVIMLGVRSVRQMVFATIELDDAMAQLKIVTRDTSKAYEEYLGKITQIATKIGSAVPDLVDSTTTFARLGYSLEESTALAEFTAMLQNVGDIDVSDAQDAITAIVKAFGVSVDEIESIMDKLVITGNNFPVSVSQIAEGMNNASSALAAAGNTFDQSVALLTAANTTIQNASKSSTGLRTIAARLRSTTTELDELGESMTEAQYGELVAALTKYNVALTDMNGEFRSTYDIVADIATIWDELSTMEQAALANAIAGVRQQSVFFSMVEQFQEASGAMEDMANSAGTLQESYATFMESTTAHINQFKAAFQSLSQSTFSADFLNGIVDTGTSVLKVLDAIVRIINAVGGLNTVLRTTVGLLVVLNADALWGQLKRLTIPIQSLILNIGVFNEAFTAAFAASSVAGASKMTGVISGLSAGFKTLTASMTTAQLAMGALVLAVAAIAGAVAVYRNLHKSTEELIESSNKLKESFQAVKEQAEDNIGTLKGLSEEFVRLADGVDRYGRNISLSANDYERYKEIIEQIVGISPELIKGYDKENGYLVDKNGLLERAIELQEQEYRNELRRMTTTSNISTAVAGSVATYSDLKSSDALKTETSLTNAIYRLFNVNERNDIPKEMESGEFLARQIMEALGVENVDKELEKYFNEHGYWQSSWFFDDYIDQIAEDIGSSRSLILPRIDFESAGFESSDDFVNAVEEVKSAASEYSDVQSELAQANKDVADQLKLVAESNRQYADLSSNAREIISDFVNSFGVDDITKAGWFGGKVIDEDAINQIKVEINEFVEKFTPEIQELVDTGFALQLGLDVDGSELSVEEYRRKVEKLLDAIDDVEDEDLQLYIRTSLGIDEDSTTLNNDIEKAVQHAKNLLQDEFDDEVSNLSISEVLQIYYNISASKNSMTFEELQEKLEYLNVDWSKTINVWDFSSVVDGLSDIESGVSDVASAMNTLQSGTALTVAELAKLAMKYPDLLKASDLFTDTSISNQQELLNSILGSYEAEYDALIDTKIAELTATNELIQNQIDLENEKKNKVVEIADLQANGKLDSEMEYQRLLNELHDLEGQDFVTYSDGVLNVNEEMLAKMLEQQGDEVDSSKPIWGALGDMIIEGHADGLTGALETFPQYLTKLKSWAGSSLKTLFSNIGTNIAKALSGDTDFVELTDGIQNLGTVSAGTVTIETQIEGDYTIDGKSVDDWAAEYKDNIEKRIQTLTDQIAANEIIKNNLDKLKGLDLKSLYGGSASNDSSKSDTADAADELEEYLADIDAYYAALKRLEAIQIQLSSLQSSIENAGSEREKIALTQQLINVYRDEIDALEVLNSLRSDTIRNGIKELEALGFEIDYNSETNEFMVRNMERLNELEGDTQEQTNELRESTEDLINTLDDLNAANQEGADSLRDFNAEIQKAKQNVIDYLKDLVTTASDAVDEIQNVFDVLKAAADEFADNGGFISVDAFQKIIELGPQYMQYLRDENGLLVINEESINRVIEAKVRQLAAEQALTYVERIRLALQEGSIENLDTLLFATTKATDATFGLAYAELELMHSMGDLNDSQYAAALHNIQAIEDLANTTVAGIGKVSGEYSENLKKELENMKSGLDDIVKYVMDMLKHRIQQQIDALEDLKNAYADIIDLRKEALDAAKKEAEYEDKVADKVKQIAKLQEKINALSLDDSRDAQAQKIKLEEELAELQKELADDQSDYAVDAQKEALDDMQTAYENEKDAEIKALEETISSYQKLYDMAIAYIESHWNTLYDELIAWNTEYGSVLNSEITEAWNNCLAAAQRYGSYVAALNSIDADIAAQTSGSGTSGTGGGTSNTVVGTTGNHSTSTKEDAIHAIIKEMYSNSQEHHTATQERKDWLSNRNLQLGTMLAQYGIKTHRDNGTWYMDGSSELLYDKYKKYIYHKGGIAGDNPTLKQNEIMAVLEKGEAVLDKRREEGLYRLVEFATTLSDKFAELMKSADMRQTLAGTGGLTDAKADIPANISDNHEIRIEFGDTYITGTNDETVEKHRAITRQQANELLGQLNIKR